MMWTLNLQTVWFLVFTCLIQAEDYLVVFLPQTLTYIRGESPEAGATYNVKYPSNNSQVPVLASPYSSGVHTPTDHWHVSKGVEQKTVLVQVPDGADVSIYVLGGYYNKLSPLPLDALGEHYILNYCEQWIGTMTVVIATHRVSSEVQIKLQVKSGGPVSDENEFVTGDLITKHLRQFSTWSFSTDRNLDGTVVTSSSTVAIYVKTQTVIQLLPVEAAGQEFIIEFMIFGEISTYFIIMNILENNTEVTLHSGSRRVFPLTGSYELPLDQHLKTSRPVLVSACTESVFLTSVLPTRLWPTSCTLPFCHNAPSEAIISSTNGSVSHVINYRSSSPIPVTWRSVTGSTFSVGNSSLPFNSTVYLKSQSPFNALVYCPPTPYFTHCGINARSDETYQPTDRMDQTHKNCSEVAYLIGFPSLGSDEKSPYIRVISGEEEGCVLIEVNSVYTLSFNIDPLTHKKIAMENLLTSENIQNKSVLVGTTNGISVYAGYSSQEEKELSPLSFEGLGREYIVVVCEGDYEYHMVIATHEVPVTVGITLKFRNVKEANTFSIDGDIYTDGDVITRYLYPFQTISFKTKLELTGTAISSTGPVGVFLEHSNFVQLIPESLKGMEYIVPKTYTIPSKQVLYITSRFPNTEILINNGTVIYVEEPDTRGHSFDVLDSFSLKTTRPVGVAICIYDTILNIVPPVEAYVTSCSVPLWPPYGKHLVLSVNTKHVHYKSVYFDWSNINGSDFKVAVFHNIFTGVLLDPKWTRTIKERSLVIKSETGIMPYLDCLSVFSLIGCGYNLNDSVSSLNLSIQMDKNMQPAMDYVVGFPSCSDLDTSPPYIILICAGEYDGVAELWTGTNTSLTRVNVTSFSCVRVTPLDGLLPVTKGSSIVIRVPHQQQMNVYAGLDTSWKKIIHLLPLNGLGQIYTVFTHVKDWHAFFSLIFAAHAKRAWININFKFAKPKEDFVNFKGKTYEHEDKLKIEIKPFETQTIISQFDLTGTTVESSSAIAVFIDQPAFSQLLPQPLYGRSYVIARTKDTRNEVMRYSTPLYNLIIITSIHDNTVVKFGNSSVIRMTKAGTYKGTYSTAEPPALTSNKPIGVAAWTNKGYYHILAPVEILASSCSLPICESLQRPVNVEIVSKKPDGMQILAAPAEWRRLPGTSVNIGKAVVSDVHPRSAIASRKFIKVDSPNKMMVLFSRTETPYVCYCGINATGRPAYTHQHKSGVTGGMDYVLALPGSEEVWITAVAGERAGRVEIHTHPSFVTAMTLQTFTSQSRASSNWPVTSGIENKSVIVRVDSLSQISIYAGWRKKSFSFTPIPVDLLGTRYVLSSCLKFPSIRQSVIVLAAYKSSTQVDIHLGTELPVQVQGHVYGNGEIINLTLLPHQTFTFTVDTDLTGTAINSTNTIAVFIGEKSKSVGSYHQLLPLEHLGKQYAVYVRSKEKTEKSLMQGLAYQNNTHLTLNNDTKITPNKNGVYKRQIGVNKLLTLTSSKSVLTSICAVDSFYLPLPTTLFPQYCCIPVCPGERQLTLVAQRNISVWLRSLTDLNILDDWTFFSDMDYKVYGRNLDTPNVLCIISDGRFSAEVYCPANGYTIRCGPSFLQEQPSMKNNTVVTYVSKIQYWIFGVGGGVLLLLICLLVILAYYLWKKRNIFIMKLVYRFQGYEDNDEREFDAFLSYRSTEEDEHFVLHTLFAKLERQLKFKICVHFKDFLPGETIANNIIQAVESSRRTLLVLSPSYIQSEFCRFEYQRAHHEMLKQKQRILPIVFKDISEVKDEMDETLKNILKSITYIEWPGEEDKKKVEAFWTKVLLCMPKRRNQDPTNQELTKVVTHVD